MNPERIEIPRILVNQLLHHAQASPELEVCGLIGSRNGVPVTCYPARNVSGTPESRFCLDAREQIDILRAMREQAEDLFAIFHSHPHGPAEPSLLDIELATYPEALYLIISLDTKGVLEMRGYRFATDGQVLEVELSLKPER
jgi:proteasome lid subunit RPN8/RPN11